ncbi:MAG: ChaN family lipoprotein [Proteobacteria bacterium]|nr:ChaN family lipoprotein [Pseudomonadota bacterium]
MNSRNNTSSQIKKRLFTLFISLFAITLIGCQSVEVKDEPLQQTASPYKSPYRPIETLETGSILHVPTGTLLSESELYSFIASSNIIYVGESHKSVNHHKVQLNIIKALDREFPEGLSVGMEMFKTSSQDEINQWLNDELSDKEFYKLWMKNWGVDFEYYRLILEYIKKNNIPLIALNAPPEAVKALAHETMRTTESTEEEDEFLSDLPTIDTTDPYHRAMTKAVFTDPNHANSNFDSFYNIQLLWEETMAETIAEYLISNAGFDQRMIVLAGGGHINYGFGIPKRLFRRLSEPYTTIMPVSTDILNDDEKAAEAIEKGAQFLEVDMPSVPLYIADFVWATEFKTITTKAPRLGVYLVENGEQVAITIVSDSTPAKEYGLLEGDVIIKLDDTPIRDILDIKYFLKDKEYGDRIVVTVKRSETTLDIKMMLKPMMKKK